MSTWRTLQLHSVTLSRLAAASGLLLLIATGCDPARDVQGVNTASSCVVGGALAQAPQALVGYADLAAGLVAGGKTDVSCSVLLAVAKVETDWGQTQTSNCPAMDAKVPGSIRQEVDTSKLAPGGQTARDLNLAGGRRICDWVSSAGAVGLMQFEPGTWGTEARGAAAAMPGLFGSSKYDPYDPTTAMIVADGYLGRLENGGVDGTHRSLHDALAAYNAGPGNQSAGNGYADQVLSLANASSSVTGGGPPGSSCAGSNACTPQSFAQAILQYPGIGGPVTPANLYAIEAWERAEGGGAGCPGQPPHAGAWQSSAGPAGNPLNTTQREPGSVGSWNSVNVQIYGDAAGHTCWYWGIKANGDTLLNGFYPQIVGVLQHPAASNSAQCLALAAAVGSTPWGTGNFQSAC